MRCNVFIMSFAVFMLTLCSFNQTYAVVAEEAFGGDQLEVVVNGSSDYVIALAEKEVDQEKNREAAQHLRDTIYDASGVRLPIVGESEVEDAAPAIYLGRTDAAGGVGIDVDSIEGWSYLMRAVENDIYLVGEDSQGTVGAHSGYSGTLKAVTAFLERYAHVRYLMPGPMGMHIPEMDSISVDADMDISRSPLFQFIAGRAVRLNFDGTFSPYAIANNYYGRSPNDTEVFKSYGGHSYYDSVPKDEYFETNPEYFALLGGERTAEGNHLCISNPEVHELILEEMEKQFDRGYQMVLLGQTDGYLECECDDCQAIHPDTAEKIWIVHRELAEEMKERRPDKQIVLLSYAHTIKPPQTFDSFPDNVVIMNNRYVPEYFRAWDEFDVSHAVYTPKWLGRHRPGSPRYEVEQVRIFRDNDVVGIYLCGGLDGYTGNSWGFNAPLYYAFGQAMSDPERSADELEQEYIEASFGEAAAPMRDFFTQYHRRTEFLALLDRRGGGIPDITQRGYPFATKPSDSYAHIFAPKIINDMNSSIERALEIAEDERVKARIELVEAEYRYLTGIAAGHHLFRAYRVRPSREMLDILEEHVQEYQQMLEWLLPDGRAREPGGPEQLRRPFSGAGAGMPDRPPYNWNFELLREQEVLPGVEEVRMEAVRVEPFELDARVDKPVWEDIPFEEMGEIRMGKPRSETKFKIAYDDDYLYVAFKAGITSPDALDDVTPVGRDGTAWRQESMELMIDPRGARQMYYHFIINPVPGSSLERRFGYFEDPEHPFYEDFEWDWRGEWEYEPRIDREREMWTAELKIPFETLEAETPQPGDMWTMNIGRSEQPEGERTVSYLWSPNLETVTFHDRAAFGELIFR